LSARKEHAPLEVPERSLRVRRMRGAPVSRRT
jgi:hypothetical protein